MGWATFLADFSQTHLVTLVQTFDLIRVSVFLSFFPASVCLVRWRRLSTAQKHDRN
jgi:hypothetical protein